VNRTTGLKNANDALKGRIFEVSLADLQKDEDHAFRKVKLRVDEVQGKNCLTNFHGLDFTSDKLRSLVRKWQSLIEANVVVKTTDDYLLRLFCIAFTKRRPNQIKKTTYARASQIRAIRKKMTDIMLREAQACTLSQLTTKLIPEVIGREIEKSTQGIYPLQNVRRRRRGARRIACSAVVLTVYYRSTSARSSSSRRPSSISATCCRCTASRRPTTPVRRWRVRRSSRRRCWRRCKRRSWHEHDRLSRIHGVCSAAALVEVEHMVAPSPSHKFETKFKALCQALTAYKLCLAHTDIYETGSQATR